MLKTCTKCKKEKEIGDFYKGRSICKKCFLKRVRELKEIRRRKFRGVI